MTVIAAEILVTGRDGAFEAETLEVADGAVRAVGRWRWRTGPNYRRIRRSEVLERTWPLRRCEIRWTEAREAA